jgi:hypothetical protein
MYIGALLASALVNHPYAQLVVLVRHELAEELQNKLNPEKFGHRVQVRTSRRPTRPPIQTCIHAILNSLAHPCPSVSTRYLRRQVVSLRPKNRNPWFGSDGGDNSERDNWAYSYWFPLVQQWLETLPMSGRGASAGEYGEYGQVKMASCSADTPGKETRRSMRQFVWGIYHYLRHSETLSQLPDGCARRCLL